MSPIAFSRTALVIAALVTLSGCADAPDGKPAVCDGHHRRPANPYGTVLPMLADDAVAKPSSPAAVKTRPSAPGPMSANDLQSIAPCGSGS